jgi:hypothetical protein
MAPLLEGNVAVGVNGANVSLNAPLPVPETGFAITKALARFVSIRHCGPPQFAGDTVIEYP